MIRLAFAVMALLLMAACAGTAAHPATPSNAPAPASADGQDPCSGAEIQLDSKGLDFEAWSREFQARVRRNWYVPQAAMKVKGCVVVTVRVHRDGRASDIAIATKSPIDAFNLAAMNAIRSSNPFSKLPAGYPEEVIAITVVFHYNGAMTNAGSFTRDRRP